VNITPILNEAFHIVHMKHLENEFGTTSCKISRKFHSEFTIKDFEKKNFITMNNPSL